MIFKRHVMIVMLITWWQTCPSLGWISFRSPTSTVDPFRYENMNKYSKHVLIWYLKLCIAFQFRRRKNDFVWNNFLICISDLKKKLHLELFIDLKFLFLTFLKLPVIHLEKIINYIIKVLETYESLISRCQFRWINGTWGNPYETKWMFKQF